MSKRIKLKQNLDKIPVYKIDTNVNSIVFDISNMPDEFTSGKNSFKIAGSTLLKQNSEILIEILDVIGNPIYYEVNNFVDRLNKRVISIFIYPDTPVGLATITILGTLNTSDIPPEWVNITNVKWNKTINVDSLKQNNSEILFDKQPVIAISEQFKPANSIFYQSGSIVTNNKTTFENSTIRYYNSVGPTWATNYSTYKDSYSDGNQTTSRSTENVQQNFNANLNRDTNFNSSLDFRIWADDEYSFIDKSGPAIILDTDVSGSGFVPAMIGGEVKIETPKNITPPIDYNNSLTGIVSDILNKTTLRLSNSYYVSSSNEPESNKFFVNNFGPNDDYEIKYTDIPIHSGSQAYKTFATVQFHNLSPISGDVYRIKTFVKSKTSLSDYELVGNNIVNRTNMFIDSSSINLDLSIGYFYSQSIIDNYWEITNLSGITSGSLLYNSSELSDAIEINYVVNDSGKLKVFPNLSQLYYTNNDYQVKFNCCGKRLTTSPILKVYMSGSAYYNSDDNNIGKLIGSITLGNEDKKAFQELSFSFSPQNSSEATPVFLIESGEWHISNIQILPTAYPGFTSNYILLNVPINSTWDNNAFDFKFEFFDYTEKMSNQIIYVENMPFNNGSPSYIQGNYNLLSGSQYIGNELGKGLVLSGEQGSTFTSTGYKGFVSASLNLGPPGFLIWSGSYDSGSIDNYSGVGAEFVSNSESFFRYRTEPSEVNIRTDKFFFGGNDMYISGSDGLLEISSSNFYLDNEGYLTATAATLRKYVFTDYIANNVLVVDTNNVNDYLIPYSHPTIGKYFNYLDLSANNKQSAMFIRFECSSSFPISHIVVPTIRGGILDNQVGGNIVLEFANDIAGDNVYFYDIRKNVGEANIEFSNVYNLSGSNSIHNLSGSFSYLGYKVNHTGSDGSVYSGSLAAKEDARYLFSKGNTGWALTGTSNFDRTGINLLEVNTPYLSGVRRSEFIRSNDLRFSNETGSYDSSFDTNFNMSCTDITLISSGGTFKYGSIYGTILMPDYIKLPSLRLILYYRIIPTLFSAGSHTVTGKITSSITSAAVSDTFDMAVAPALTAIPLGSITASSITTLTTGNEMVPWAVDIADNTYFNSGQLIGFKIDITELKRLSSHIPGKLRIFGVRYITDKYSNFGGFSKKDYEQVAKNPEISLITD